MDDDLRFVPRLVAGEYVWDIQVLSGYGDEMLQALRDFCKGRT